MKVCVLYGGKSGEHEVSLRSAASVAKNLDPEKYEIAAVGIDKSGRWFLQGKLTTKSGPEGNSLLVADTSRIVSCVPGEGLFAGGRRLDVACAFPVLHGTYGEDGTVQGLLELAGIPYVGAGVLASSVSLDKEKTKCLWRDAGLPVLEFSVVGARHAPAERLEAARRVGFPVFVKPCSAGSSLGASRARTEGDLDGAIQEALRYDTRALVERFVDAREIECSVIGNHSPRAFLPGEVVPSQAHPFYDYEAKYTDPDGAALVAPARLPPEVQDRVMRMAEAAYGAVGCEGMARIDFFLIKDSGGIVLNEINTIPGFTSISMFPRMCETSGLSYGKLLDTLIDLAMERDRERASVSYSFEITPGA